MKRIGIIGCGNIGGQLAEYIRTELKGSMELAGVLDIDKELALEAAGGNGDIVCNGVDELIERVDCVVEAACPKCVEEIFPLILKHRKSLVVISPLGLVKNPGFLKQAQDEGIRIYVPSGAIAGIDALKAACMADVESVVLTTKKPCRGLAGAPYIEKNGIDLDAIKTETVIFDGCVFDAIDAFPKNVNVSAILAIAGIGGDKTRVKVVTSPEFERNMHEIEIKGEFGSLVIQCCNKPSRKNPRTSYLSVLSAKALLKGIACSVRVGT